jgi:murein hydrolase activator
MAAALAFLLAAATPEARLAEIDRHVRAQELRLAHARAPLAALVAQAERIALRPPAMALADHRSAQDLIRTRALLTTLGPAIRARSLALQREMIATAGERAALAQEVAARADARTRFGSLDGAALNRRLAALPAPDGSTLAQGRPVYLLPARGRVVVGTGDRAAAGIAARGLTLATPAGTRVIAPAGGRIVYAGPFRGYGDIALIDHGGGWATLLAGLSLATVGRGDRVEQSAAVGRMGDGTPRLTIELTHHGRPVDVAGMAAQTQ